MADAKKNPLLENLPYVMKDGVGREFIWHFLDQSGLFLDPFHSNSERTTEYLLGRAAAARDIYRELMLPENTKIRRLMENEANQRTFVDKSGENTNIAETGLETEDEQNG